MEAAVPVEGEDLRIPENATDAALHAGTMALHRLTDVTIRMTVITEALIRTAAEDTVDTGIKLHTTRTIRVIIPGTTHLEATHPRHLLTTPPTTDMVEVRDP